MPERKAGPRAKASQKARAKKKTAKAGSSRSRRGRSRNGNWGALAAGLFGLIIIIVAIPRILEREKRRQEIEEHNREVESQTNGRKIIFVEGAPPNAPAKTTADNGPNLPDQDLCTEGSAEYKKAARGAQNLLERGDFLEAAKAFKSAMDLDTTKAERALCADRIRACVAFAKLVQDVERSPLLETDKFSLIKLKMEEDPVLARILDNKEGAIRYRGFDRRGYFADHLIDKIEPAPAKQVEPALKKYVKEELTKKDHPSAMSQVKLARAALEFGESETAAAALWNAWEKDRDILAKVEDWEANRLLRKGINRAGYDPNSAGDLFFQLKTRYPDTEAAAQADKMIAQLQSGETVALAPEREEEVEETVEIIEVAEAKPNTTTKRPKRGSQRSTNAGEINWEYVKEMLSDDIFGIDSLDQKSVQMAERELALALIALEKAKREYNDKKRDEFQEEALVNLEKSLKHYGDAKRRDPNNEDLDLALHVVNQQLYWARKMERIH